MTEYDIVNKTSAVGKGKRQLKFRLKKVARVDIVD